MMMRRLVASCTAIAFAIAACPPSLALAAVTQVSLTANPATVLAGQSTTLTLVTPASYRSAVNTPVPIVFGDGSGGTIFMSFNDATNSFRGSVLHAYARPGTYQASVTLTVSGLAAIVQKFTATVTVVAPATPQPTVAPPQPPLPTPQPKATPEPGYPIAGMTLNWPNGTTRLTLAPNQAIPQAIARIRFSRTSAITGQWFIDGMPMQTVRLSGSQNQTVEIRYAGPLPRGGTHEVAFHILAPAATGLFAPTPAPPIEYGIQSVAIAPPSTHGWYDGPPPVVHFPSTIQQFHEGRINLETPSWYTAMEGQPFVLLPPPYLDDSTQFTWQEQNPGTATTFQFRVLARDRHTVLATKTLDANTTYYIPDAAFLENTLSKVVRSMHFCLGGNPSSYTPSNNPTVCEAGLFWEVRGYAAAGVSGKTIEVEKSDVWPLLAPQTPDGLAECASTDGNWKRGAYGQQGNLQVVDIDATTKNPQILSQDRVQLTGNVDASQSPYALAPSQVQAPPASPDTLIAPPWTAATLSNVLVDWGDGNITAATVEPSANSSDSTVQQRDQNVRIQLPGASDSRAMMHRYDYSGQYTVRVFEIPQADLQHLDLQQLALYLDGSALAQNVPYFAVRGPGLSGPFAAHPAQFASGGFGALRDAMNGTTDPARVAHDAYTIGCLPVTVDPGVDNIAEGPLHLQSVRVDDFGAYTAGKSPVRPGLTAIAPAVVGDATTCDVGLGANADLRFKGTGDVKVDWYVDDQLVDEESPPGLPKLSSPRLTNLTRAESGHVSLDQALTGTQTLVLGNQSFTHAGRHPVRVSVDVVPVDAGSPNLSRNFRNFTRSAAASSHVKIGFLSPLHAEAAYSPLVAYMNGFAAHNDQHVESADSQAYYNIGQANAKEPCKFVFKTADGDFTVSGLQGHVTRGSDGRWRGRGVLPLQLASDGGTQPFSVAVPINGWLVPDNLHVEDGTIDVSSHDFGDYGTGGPGLAVGPVTVALVRLHSVLSGGTSSHMNLTLNAALSDQLLAIAGSTKTPSFGSLTAPLDSDGNWISGAVSWPRIELGNSGFFLTASSAVVDLSAKSGAPGPAVAQNCGTNNPSFVGIEFNDPKLHVNTFNLTGTNDAVAADGWVVTSQGLCGHVGGTNNVGFRALFEDGSVNIPSVEANVSESNLSASYPDMNAHIPWLDVTLATSAGNPITFGTTGVENFSLGYAQPVVKDYGSFRMETRDLQLTSLKNVGWAVAASSTFDYSNEGVHFATIDMPQMYFTLGGRPLFNDGSPAADVQVGGSTKFADTPLNLGSAHLTAATNGADQLATTFRVQTHLSESLPAADTQVNYDVRRGSCNGGFCSDAPTMNPFKTEVAFPLGQPTVDGQITPHYIHEGSDDRYEGQVDLSMFGGPPVKAQFLLGYQGGSDYWLFRADVPLSPAGVPVVPGVLNLYQLGGGMGYHIKLNSPSDTADIHHVSFDPSTDLTFIADMQMGSADGGSTYYLDGEFTIFTGQNSGGRLTYKAWLLSTNHDPGKQTLDGFFQYAGDNFDGGMEGQLSLTDAIYVRVPGPNFGGGSTYGISMHAGGGTWYVYVGRKEGPRIQLHLLVADADGYVMLDNNGLDVGGGTDIDLDIGDDSVASAFARGHVEIEVAITPQPHVSGNFDANLDVGACISGECVSDNVDAAVHAEAMPLDLDATATIGMPWPIPDLTVHVHA